MSTQRLLVLHALSPLHVGTGQGEGLIDLPVARDIVTGHPLIPGSGIKGPLRAAAGEGCEAVFGPDTHNASAYGSAVRFSDARLLALPVPSDFGTFAWVTSPLVLARWRRDAASIVSFPDGLPEVAEGMAACLPDAAVTDKGQLVLDAESFAQQPLANAWADLVASLAFPDDPTWREMVRQRLVVLSDDTFDALCRTGTDVRAHVRIAPGSGVVERGGLWYEESVPAESLFTSVVHFVGNGQADAEAAEAQVRHLLDGVVSFGGGKTTGMGMMSGQLHGGAA